MGVTNDYYCGSGEGDVSPLFAKPRVLLDLFKYIS